MKNHGELLDQSYIDQIQSAMLSTPPQPQTPIKRKSRRKLLSPESTASAPIIISQQHQPTQSFSSFSFSNPEFTSLYDRGLHDSTPNLQKYMPTVLKCIHKNTNFEEKLRDISQISGNVFETALDMLHHILEHFHRQACIIELEKDDLIRLETCQDHNSLLLIGGYFVQDFNVDSSESSFYTALRSTNWSPVEDKNKEQYTHKGRGSYLNTAFDLSHHDRELQSILDKRKKINIPAQMKVNSTMSLRSLSFVKELVFSLLTGRTVIISGSSENAVRSLVNSCSVFIPGKISTVNHDEDCQPYTNTNVCPWRVNRTTQLSDLCKYKLIGTHYDSKNDLSQNNVFEAHCTKLNIDNQILHTRVKKYRGYYLEQLFDREKRWPDEPTFLSYIHTMLAEISQKACLLYHLNQNRQRAHRRTPTPHQLYPPSLHHSPTSPSQPLQHTDACHPPTFVPPLRKISSSESPRRFVKAHISLSLKKKAPSQLRLAPSSSSPSPIDSPANFYWNPTCHELELTRDCEKAYARQLGIKHDDLMIVDYLVEVIRRQQGSEQKKNRFSIQNDTNVMPNVISMKN
ncbi:hypothetical protein AKO1_007236, partial [Acrasis kona]